MIRAGPDSAQFFGTRRATIASVWPGEIVLFDSDPPGARLSRFAWGAAPLFGTVAFLARHLTGRSKLLLYAGSAAASLWFAVGGDGPRRRVVIAGRDVRVESDGEVSPHRADHADAVTVNVWELRDRANPAQIVSSRYWISIVFAGGLTIAITPSTFGTIADATTAANRVSAYLTAARTIPMPEISLSVLPILDAPPP
jgi:hypothetical protein